MQNEVLVQSQLPDLLLFYDQDETQSDATRLPSLRYYHAFHDDRPSATPQQYPEAGSINYHACDIVIASKLTMAPSDRSFLQVCLPTIGYVSRRAMTRGECEEPHQERSQDQIPTLPLVDFRWTQTSNKGLMDGQADVHFCAIDSGPFWPKYPALLHIYLMYYFSSLLIMRVNFLGFYSCFFATSLGNSINTRCSIALLAHQNIPSTACRSG